jgi:hypothetical protein
VAKEDSDVGTSTLPLCPSRTAIQRPSDTVASSQFSSERNSRLLLMRDLHTIVSMLLTYYRCLTEGRVRKVAEPEDLSLEQVGLARECGS